MCRWFGGLLETYDALHVDATKLSMMLRIFYEDREPDTAKK